MNACPRFLQVAPVVAGDDVRRPRLHDRRKVHRHPTCRSVARDRLAIWRRSAGVSPPQTPSRSSAARAYARHSATTGHAPHANAAASCRAALAGVDRDSHQGRVRGEPHTPASRRARRSPAATQATHRRPRAAPPTPARHPRTCPAHQRVRLASRLSPPTTQRGSRMSEAGIKLNERCAPPAICLCSSRLHDSWTRDRLTSMAGAWRAAMKSFRAGECGARRSHTHLPAGSHPQGGQRRDLHGPHQPADRSRTPGCRPVA